MSNLKRDIASLDRAASDLRDVRAQEALGREEQAPLRRAAHVPRWAVHVRGGPGRPWGEGTGASMEVWTYDGMHWFARYLRVAAQDLPESQRWETLDGPFFSKGEVVRAVRQAAGQPRGRVAVQVGLGKTR